MDKVEPEEEASKAVWDGMKGKVKKAVGSAIGSEKMVVSGELLEAQAEARKEAAARQEEADRLREQAAGRLVAKEQTLAEQHARTSEEEAQGLAQVQRDKQMQDLAIQEKAGARAQAAQRRAEQHHQEIARQEQQAAKEREDVGREAAEQRQAADEARAAAADLDAVSQSSTRDN